VEPTGEQFAAVVGVLRTYLDGLHHSDTDRLAAVFHPAARYITPTGDELVDLALDEYLPIVADRPSPASKGEARRDRIVSVELAGPDAAFVRVECAVAPRVFTDLLTLVRVDGRWQIIAKVFHYDLEEDPCPT
jgi:putative lumazine-binding protein